jgi:hypothetical protein
MSLTLIIVINVALDAALIGGLAWAMSRPSRLAPHRRQFGDAEAPLRQRTRRGGLHGSQVASLRSSRATG